LIRKVEHRADCPEVERGGASGSSVNYSNRFECFPLEVDQPPVARAKPRVFGYQTAVVVGPPGEEIHTDRHGRVKVLMHWDREQRDEVPDTSCWLRVAQMWAGAGWGTLFLPRVGMEVLVSFIDGDPDRPIVTGCVYNGANQPPYSLPNDRTKSTIKTSSSPGGSGFNELRFEDAKGTEELFMQAQRDMNTNVLRNQSTTVGNDQRVTVKNDRTVDITGYESDSVGKDRMRSVDGNEEITIAGSQYVQIGAPAVPGEAPGAKTPAVPGAEVHVTGTHTIEATEKLVLKVGATSLVITAQNLAITTDGSVDVGAANSSMSLREGLVTTNADVVSMQAETSSLLLERAAKLESEYQVRCQVDQSKMVCDRFNVRAEGLNALIKGTAVAAVTSKSDILVKGANIQVYGTACVDTNSDGAISMSAGGIKETIGGFINLG
jgi:type VI secretion system secreted protein VgrG